jgi:hypothetical protein
MPTHPPPNLDQAPDWYRRLVLAMRRRRLSLRLTHLDIDTRIGCTTGLVSKWECYDRRPTTFFFSCWAEALGLEICVRKKRP